MTTRYADLEGARVLVTGASGGLGAAMARAFGAQGARVVVHYRTRAEGAAQTAVAVAEAGGEAVKLHADLRSEAAIERLVEAAWAQWDGLDVVVNNAGVVLKAAILDAGSRWWDEVLGVNLRAPYLLSRLVAARMIDAGIRGTILHNSSIHARRSTQFFSAYAASKAALEMLASVQALEWAEHGIRVNCVAPGVVPVERTAQALAEAEALWRPHIPLGRYGRPQDIAELTLFLASQASGWTTGQSFVADGGMLARIDMPRRPRPPLPPEPDPIEEP